MGVIDSLEKAVGKVSLFDSGSWFYKIDEVRYFKPVNSMSSYLGNTERIVLKDLQTRSFIIDEPSFEFGATLDSIKTNLKKQGEVYFGSYSEYYFDRFKPLYINADVKSLDEVSTYFSMAFDAMEHFEKEETIRRFCKTIKCENHLEKLDFNSTLEISNLYSWLIDTTTSELAKRNIRKFLALVRNGKETRSFAEWLKDVVY